MSDLISRQKAKDAIDMTLDHIDHVPSWVYDNLLNALNEVPSVKPTHPTPSNTLGAMDCVDRQDAINAMEKINRVFNDLGLSCAYDMPSFWCHDGKDYKVIQTKYHKGYQQALSDAEKRIKLILEELCYG